MTEYPLPHINDDLQILEAAARAAGDIALSYFRGRFDSWTKDHASPVTEVDIRLDHELKSRLLAARPAYGWLSEEQKDDGSRHHAPRTFIVDPIDGTRGFIKGDDSWCVSVALVEGSVPVAGVIHAPARNETLVAARGCGSFLNGSRLYHPQPLDGARRRISAPPAVHDGLTAAGLAYTRTAGTASLANRLGLVARGALDAALVRPGARDWDIAAALVILRELDIEPVDARKGALHLNGVETSHGPLAVTPDPSLRTAALAVLTRVYGGDVPRD